MTVAAGESGTMPCRLGVLIPPGNVACEAEMPAYVPAGYQLHFNRLSREGSSLSSTSLLAMGESTGRAARDLADVRPQVILYACTSGTFLAGPDRHAEIAEAITAATGVSAFTTSTAVINALRQLKALRVFMVTPYPDDINEAELAFLRHNGFEMTGFRSFSYRDSQEIRRTPSSATAEFVLGHRDEALAADAVFISCTNLLTLDQIARLEGELDRPVVSSNSATLWCGLSAVGAPLDKTSLGRLCRHSYSPG